jgi:hypothetical protein
MAYSVPVVQLLSEKPMVRRIVFGLLAACRSNAYGYDNEVGPIRNYQCHENLRALIMKQP